MYKNLNIIINADDFGYSTSVNKAILTSFQQQIITTTTILANGEEFEDACQIAEENGLLDFIGIHINLTEGNPLTERIKSCKRFCDDKGMFRCKRNNLNSIMPLSYDEKIAVTEEVLEQIKKCRNRGMKLTHADSHHHKHTELPIGLVLMELLKQERIPFIRLSRNFGRNINLIKKIYKNNFNNKIKSKLGTVDYFGSFDDFLEPFSDKNARYIEIMCHPLFNKYGDLVDLDGSNLLTKLNLLKEKLKGFKAVAYSEIYDSSLFSKII